MNSGQCEICGHSNPEVIETHHKVPKRFGGTDHPSNLVELCGSCHNAIESIYNDEIFTRLQEKIGYELEEVDIQNVGIDVDSINSPDRGFPSDPVHVTIEQVEPVELIDWGVATAEELETAGHIDLMTVEEWKEQVRRFEMEREGEVLDETEEFLEENEDVLPKYEQNRDIALIHCGYCQTAFYDWDQAQAAKHLRIHHHVENPYLSESDNLSDWEKQKRTIKANNVDTSTALGGLALSGALEDEAKSPHSMSDSQRPNDGLNLTHE